MLHDIFIDGWQDKAFVLTSKRREEFLERVNEAAEGGSVPKVIPVIFLRDDILYASKRD